MSATTREIFYGLRVNTADLMTAALAFAKTRAPLRALELIKLRRANESLHVVRNQMRSSSLILIPVEVWDMVALALISMQVVNERTRAQGRPIRFPPLPPIIDLTNDSSDEEIVRSPCQIRSKSVAEAGYKAGRS